MNYMINSMVKNRDSFMGSKNTKAHKMSLNGVPVSHPIYDFNMFSLKIDGAKRKHWKKP